ncbi:MAG: sugar ABC transporter permease, partial [Actinoplanes sp.]
MAVPQLAAPPSARSTGRRRRRSWSGWQFVGPFMAVFALVFLAPIAYSIYLSLFKDRLIGGNSFVGLENYQQVFQDPNFWSGLGRVTLFLLVQVPIMLFLALLVALALDSGRLYGASFFRVSIFLPYAVPAVVAALIWGFMYGSQFGLVGNINDSLGINLPDPLKPSLILAAIGNISTWTFVGYNMLIFYSALKVVPKSLYESAEIDGAGQLRIIRSIKLPA